MAVAPENHQFRFHAAVVVINAAVIWDAEKNTGVALLTKEGTMEKDLSTEVAALSATVSGLKRERWMWRVALAVLAGFILIGAGTGKSVLDELRTRKIVIVDGEGKTRALLDVFPYGPELVLFDAQGDVRAWLTVTTGGPALVLYDPQGEERAALTAYSGVPELVLYDGYGKRGADVTLLQADKTGKVELRTSGSSVPAN